MGDEGRHRRQEDQLACGIGRSQKADDKPLARPEPAPDDIDGRSPAIVAWHDGELFCLIASDTMSSDQLVRIAISLYGQRRKARLR